MKFKRTLKKSRLRAALALLLAAALALPGAPLLAQDGTGGNATPSGNPGLDRDEIQSPRVDFINRNNNRFSAAARRAEVAGGSALADQVVANQNGDRNGITVRRIFDKDAKGYGADIMTIEPRANIGHINRIQRMLTGYLMKAFEYNRADAETLSRFVLYYNANNRQNMDLLKEKYNPAVAEAVDEKKLGIDRSYRNWSGNTQMVIPIRLSAVRPGESDLNLQEVDKETDNVDPDEKKELDELQRKRNEEEAKKLDEKAEDLEKESETLKKEEEELKREQDKAEQDRTDTGKRLEELRDDPNADPEEVKQVEEEVKQLEEKQEEIVEQIEENEQAQEETAEKQEEVKEQQQEVAEAQEEAANNEETAAEETGGNETANEETAAKIEELQKENEELKKAAEEKEEVSENVVEDKILFMRVLRYSSKGHYANELWFIDAAKDDALQRSAYTRICSREFVVMDGEGILVTGYIGSVDDPTEHRLVMLDSENLDKKVESKERVSWNTPMINKDEKIYAIMEKDGEYYLARFNTDLSLDQASASPVNINSNITFYKDKIYLTGKPRSGENTTIQVFKREDLELMKTIEPPANSTAGR